MSTAQVVVLVVAVLLGVGFLLLTLFVTKRRKQVTAEVTERLGADDIVLVDDRARCLGIESRGSGTLQAMGCLALTGDRLLFVQWSPRDEVELPRRDILGLDEGNEHLGHERRGELLRLRFRNPEATWEMPTEKDDDDGGGDEGDEHRPGKGLEAGVDAVAFEVDDLTAWRTALEG